VFSAHEQLSVATPSSNAAHDEIALNNSAAAIVAKRGSMCAPGA